MVRQSDESSAGSADWRPTLALPRGVQITNALLTAATRANMRSGQIDFPGAGLL